MNAHPVARGRTLFLFGLMLLGGLALVARTAYWQVIEHDRLVALAGAKTEVTFTEPTQRGTIYDRTGTVILASSVNRYRVIGAPHDVAVAKRSAVATRIVALLGVQGTAANSIVTAFQKDSRYVILADGVEESVAATLRTAAAAGEISGISLELQPTRVYPLPGAGQTSLAAQLLGFVNAEGAGQYGVEQRYQDVLAGEPRVVVAQADPAGHPVFGTETVVQAGSPGADLQLTLDSGLQSAVEQEVFAAWVADRAKSVSAIVMDPYTGEVYAQATYPSYDANAYQKTANSDPGLFRDPVIADVYEPGSVMKMLTATAAYGAGVVNATTRFVDNGSLTLDRGITKISDAGHPKKGPITFEDGIAQSRNVVAALTALKLGKTTAAASAALYATWHRLGIGSPTGIDLVGEASGLVQDPTKEIWRQIDLANGSFGQGVAVTPLQLATAFSAMVNGGTLVQPHVVRSIDGTELTVTDRGRVMTPDTSMKLTELMTHVVTSVPFYRSRTLVPGYLVGGKTGTAQIWDSKAGDWKKNIFNFSFVGFIGKETPRLVVAVRINEGTTTVNKPGDIEMPVMSFELFRRIATDGITMLDLPPATAQLAASW